MHFETRNQHINIQDEVEKINKTRTKQRVTPISNRSLVQPIQPLNFEKKSYTQGLRAVKGRLASANRKFKRPYIGPRDPAMGASGRSNHGDRRSSKRDQKPRPILAAVPAAPKNSVHPQDLQLSSVRMDFYMNTSSAGLASPVDDQTIEGNNGQLNHDSQQLSPHNSITLHKNQAPSTVVKPKTFKLDYIVTTENEQTAQKKILTESQTSGNREPTLPAAQKMPEDHTEGSGSEQVKVNSSNVDQFKLGIHDLINGPQENISTVVLLSNTSPKSPREKSERGRNHVVVQGKNLELVESMSPSSPMTSLHNTNNTQLKHISEPQVKVEKSKSRAAPPAKQTPKPRMAVKSPSGKPGAGLSIEQNAHSVTTLRPTMAYTRGVLGSFIKFNAQKGVMTSRAGQSRNSYAPMASEGAIVAKGRQCKKLRKMEHKLHYFLAARGEVNAGKLDTDENKLISKGNQTTMDPRDSASSSNYLRDSAVSVHRGELGRQLEVHPASKQEFSLKTRQQVITNIDTRPVGLKNSNSDAHYFKPVSDRKEDLLGQSKDERAMVQKKNLLGKPKAGLRIMSGKYSMVGKEVDHLQSDHSRHSLYQSDFTLRNLQEFENHYKTMTHKYSH